MNKSILNRQRLHIKASSLLTGLLMLMLAVLFSACRQHQPAELPKTQCQRVISLSPSVTEILYALDLGRQVVGVTRFCKYPPEARQKASVGGYVDPNVEAMVHLQPDLVIIRKEQAELIQQVRDLGIPVLTVEHRNMKGILDSFGTIGQVCHREAKANTYVTQLNHRIEAVRRQVKKAVTQPKVLVALDRDVSSDTVHWVFVAGQDSIYEWVVRQVGGQNAVPPGRPGFMQISSEGILRMNPDVIIELLPSVQASQENAREIQKQWAGLSSVSAVQNRRIYLFSKDYMMIPGPRFVRTMEEFARVIHPELDWKHDLPAQRS